MTGLYKVKASTLVKSSKLWKVFLASACTLSLAAVSLPVPASAPPSGSLKT
ncbi:MAG: hypothetical protein ACRC62_37425 [Microcoleus sp.]